MNNRTLWLNGQGPIQHRDDTVQRVDALIDTLVSQGQIADAATAYDLFSAADRLTCMAMSVVAHMTYARRIDLDGKPLQAEDFKPTPEGHTGGALNMVPAFVGYLLANALSGVTRGWLMGQGHCVAAIEAVNALTGDVSDAQRGRYNATAEGLARLIGDFYSYAIDDNGHVAVPLGSHAGPNTAGAISEGGYLGFASLQYVHMPLPGERLVAFLSDGAFEEQRGSDWAPRWWRAEDSGLAVPVMILNGRRIEQRTQIIQEGGAEWLAEDLRHNGFAPVIVDGRDPAAIAVAIINADQTLLQFAEDPERRYPAALPYVIAETEKGFGFPGAGTNAAHNLPLSGNPHFDATVRQAFNDSAAALFVPPHELDHALKTLANHTEQHRARESQHPMAHRYPSAPALPLPVWEMVGTTGSAMTALDRWFMDFVQANPQLRVRIGNPDELASNKMGGTLALLKHRVNEPEAGVPEDVYGSVITALNEEAVAAAALGNKGGLNLIVSYEAFAVKMLGLMRQEIIFARRQKELGQNPGWVSVPLIVTSHTWENSKNEQSHQDPTIGEALLGEMSDTSRLLFPVDGNTAAAALRNVYSKRGQVACLVVSKRDVTQYFDAATAAALVRTGAAHIAGDPSDAEVQFIAIGSYQLEEALKAHHHLLSQGVNSCVTVVIEPGRLRQGRDEIESNYVIDDETLYGLFPRQLPRVILTHTRPEPMLGVLRRLDGGPHHTRALGYINRGGTLDVPGMLLANRCTWTDAIKAAAELTAWGRVPLDSAGTDKPSHLVHKPATLYRQAATYKPAPPYRSAASHQAKTTSKPALCYKSDGESKLSFTSLGGAGTVTGSKHLLCHEDTRIMVDCGLFQGLKNLRTRNWEPLAVDAEDVDAVVLTHGHLDHCGYLPRLMVNGFNGQVFSTHATRDVAKLILLDSAWLQEKDAEYANRKGFSKHQPALPLYTVKDAERTMSHFKSVDWHQTVDLPGDAKLTLRRAGHILGASTAQIDIGGKRIVFSGDLGVYDDPMMFTPDPVTEADYVVIESTYGNRLHDDHDPVQVLGDIVDRTIRRGGTVVIPAFAVGRAQMMIYYLWQLRQQGKLLNVPIYLDSPMASSATALLHDHPDDHKLNKHDFEEAFSCVNYVRDVEESKALTMNRFPKVIISASGMATGGRVLHHIAAFGSNHQNTLLMSGFQAAGTRGRKLLEGAKEVKIHGQWRPIKAEIAELPMLSAHADADGLLRWLSDFKQPPKHVFIVHGEASASDALRERIERELGWSVSVPLQDETYYL